MNRVSKGAAAEFRPRSATTFGLEGIRDFSSGLRGLFLRACVLFRSLFHFFPAVKGTRHLVPYSLRVWCSALLFCVTPANSAAEAEGQAAVEEAAAEEESPWDWAATARGGTGYKDN